MVENGVLSVVGNDDLPPGYKKFADYLCEFVNALAKPYKRADIEREYQKEQKTLSCSFKKKWPGNKNDDPSILDYLYLLPNAEVIYDSNTYDKGEPEQWEDADDPHEGPEGCPGTAGSEQQKSAGKLHRIRPGSYIVSREMEDVRRIEFDPDIRG